MSTEQQTKQQIKVRYTETHALYASQFICNTSAEDLIINFSSGPMSDPGAGETILPIHTRIAMTREGARRLHAVLGQILGSPQTEKSKSVPGAQAQLPKMQ